MKMASKQRIDLILILALVAPILVLSAPQPAYACTCAGPATPAKGLAQADAVFAGKVTAIKASTMYRFTSSREMLQVTFTVSDVWKGNLHRKTTLSTAPSGEACGYEFALGRDYLVYASESRDGLSTGLCTRTRTLSSAAGDLSVLGTAATPAPGRGANGLATFLVPAALLASLALLIFAVLYFVRQQVRVEG